MNIGNNENRDKIPIDLTQRKELLERGIRVFVEGMYQQSLNEFLFTNPLSDELFFIDYIYKNQKERLKEINEQINFFDIDHETYTEWYKNENENELNEWYDNKLIRDEYWNLIVSQKFLEERKKSILIKSNNESVNESEIFLDYSDNSAAEKIVFLYKLGILEYLSKIEPFNTSTNKLAKIISAFTGIGSTTIQSYLNPIYSKQVDQKHNPLTEKNIKKVLEKLLKIGYTK